MGDTNVVEWIFIDDESVLGMSFIDSLYFRSSAGVSNARLTFPQGSAGEAVSTWDSVTHTDGWPSMGLRFQPGTDEREILEKLMRAVRDERYAGKFDVFVTKAYHGSVEPEGERYDEFVTDVA